MVWDRRRRDGGGILVVTETAASPRQLRLLNAAVACAIFTGCVMFAKNIVDNAQPAYWCTACIASSGRSA